MSIDIVKWFKLGASDELTSNATTESDNDMENQAYILGAYFAMNGAITRESLKTLTTENIYHYIARGKTIKR